MKNWTGLLLTSIALLASLAVPAEGQSLAEAARREAERRKAATEPSKVYTAGDLETSRRDGVVPAKGPFALVRPAVQPSGTSDKSDQAADAATASTDPGKTSAEVPKPRDKRPEEHWRERAELIQGRLRHLRADVAAIEGRVAELRAELESAPAARAAALANEARQAGEDLTRFQVELRHIEQEWTAFEERARQAKIPVNWIR